MRARSIVDALQALSKVFSKPAKLTLGCAILGCLLASCLSSPRPPPIAPPIVYIYGMAKAHINDSQVTLQAGRAQTLIPADAATAKFFIGSWESALVEDSQIQYSRFQATVENTCETLPQGDNQLARYELYDAAGTVVKQDETQISVVTCPGGQP